ncbi:hypothetical protein [Longimicrobium sp.]|uniref:hypothetical protein n=1 Tax=Longimicrobium sp. TaxID=2029185 RepID=UPI002F955F01
MNEPVRNEAAPCASAGLSLCTFSVDDVPLSLAVSAHGGTSLSPERRGEQERAGYVAHMEHVCATLAPLATTDEQREYLRAALERYKSGYLRRLSAHLAAKGRCLSPMITGPANFPAARNEKANASERKRGNELQEWSAKALAAMQRDLGRTNGGGPILSDDPDAPDLLRQKIDEAERLQVLMREANKIVRSKHLSADEKAEQLAALGPAVPAEVSRGFPSYALTNNAANIRRMRDRLTLIERRRAQAPSEFTGSAGVRVVDNVAANRVQVIHPGKPPKADRDAMKRHGFRWAPSAGAWQRHRSAEALRVAKQIAGVADATEAA